MDNDRDQDLDLVSDKEFTILIVDDEESDRIMIAEVVGKMGHIVKTAKNGEEALIVLEDVEVDLVLMDVTMPELSGFEITKKIRSFGQYLPIIALTAYSSEENRAQARDAGMNGFISKPINFDELQTMIQDFLVSAF